MDDITLTGIGMWILTTISAIVVFIAFLLGKLSNGFPVEFATFCGTILAATEVLAILVVKKYFKIKE